MELARAKEIESGMQAITGCVLILYPITCIAAIWVGGWIGAKIAATHLLVLISLAILTWSIEKRNEAKSSEATK